MAFCGTLSLACSLLVAIMCFLFACVKKPRACIPTLVYKIRMLVLEPFISFERAIKREKKRELFTDI